MDILETRLASQGYEIVTAADGEAALRGGARAPARPDPARRHDAEAGRDRGLPAAQGRSAPALHADHPGHRQGRPRRTSWPGLEAGADEYLTKPVDQAALVARVKSMLRIKALHDVRCRPRSAEAAAPSWNRTLEQRVAEQVARARAGRPAAALPVAADRRADRRWRATSDPAGEPPPRGRGRVLRPARLHRLRRDGRAGGGDGRPARVPRRAGRADPPLRGHAGALRRRRADGLLQRPGALPRPGRSARCGWPWRCATRCDGLAGRLARARLSSWASASASPRATRRSGRIGFEGRFDYAAIGSVSNLGARLCAEARPARSWSAGRSVTRLRISPWRSLCRRSFSRALPILFPSPPSRRSRI